MHPRQKTRKASRCSSLLLAAAVLLGPVSSLQAQQQGASSPGALQAFMLTTTYGVIAGSLTGLASLAFYDKPGDHSRNIAVGASLGLYVGLLLGTYVVYGPSIRSSLPSMDDAPEIDEDDPINLGARVTPWVDWNPAQGGRVGLVYNF